MLSCISTVMIYNITSSPALRKKIHIESIHIKFIYQNKKQTKFMYEGED